MSVVASKRIIIIDDDKMTIFLSTKILQNYSQDLQVDSFLSGKEAIKYFHDNPVLPNTLILLDINMPVYNGWDFLDEYSAMPSNCPVFMFTSSIAMNDVEKSKTYEKVKGFISKPLNSEKISEFLADAFN